MVKIIGGLRGKGRRIEGWKGGRIREIKTMEKKRK